MRPPRVSPSSSSSAGRWFLGRPGAFYPSCKPQSYPDNGTQISTNAMTDDTPGHVVFAHLVYLPSLRVLEVTHFLVLK